MFQNVINTLCGCKTTIVFTLKMESVTQNIIFGLKILLKSGLELFIFKILLCGKNRWLILRIIEFGILCTCEVKENRFPYGGLSKILFLDYFSPKMIFSNSNLRVKTTVVSQHYSGLSRHYRKFLLRLSTQNAR